MPSISQKPYLLRALYEWAVDNGYTPNLIVSVNDQTVVPRQYVQDGQIVLNIGPNAVNGLIIDSHWVRFRARFGGVAQEVEIPVGRVATIFARETGEGMPFEVDEGNEPPPPPDNPPSTPNSGGRGHLRVVK